MTGGTEELILAMTLFVGGHFLLSHPTVRPRLVRQLGENGFTIAYSLAAIVALVWALMAYGRAPYVALWPAEPWTRLVPVAVMPVALFLVVAALTTPNVTAVGGERLATHGDPAPGIMRVTRHPMMWGVLLWALSHLPPNGDLASLVLFGGMAVLSGGGMLAIDAKKAARLGPAWGPIALTTSVLPFKAILEGRARFDAAGIGWWRPLLAALLYIGLLHGHAYVAGVPVGLN